MTNPPRKMWTDQHRGIIINTYQTAAQISQKYRRFNREKRR